MSVIQSWTMRASLESVPSSWPRRTKTIARISSFHRMFMPRSLLTVANSTEIGTSGKSTSENFFEGARAGVSSAWAELFRLGLVPAFAFGGLGLQLCHVRLGDHVRARHGLAVDLAFLGKSPNPAHRAAVPRGSIAARQHFPPGVVLHQCNHPANSTDWGTAVKPRTPKTCPNCHSRHRLNYKRMRVRAEGTGLWNACIASDCRYDHYRRYGYDTARIAGGI